MAILQALKVNGITEQMPGVGDGQSLKCVASTYSWTAAPAAADVIQSALIQQGCTIVDVVVVHSGLGTSGTFRVGYGLDDDYFVVSGAQATAGVVRSSAATAFPLVLTANDTVDVVVNAQGASATGSISIIVYFLPVYTG